MRVLHVVCSDRFAGVERHVALLAGAQHDAGASVAVIGGDPALMRRDIDREAVTFRPAGGLLATIRTARPFVHGADIVHVHMTASEVAGVVAALGSEAAVITTRHFADGRGSTSVNRWVGRRAADRIDAQISVSAYAASYVEGPSVVVHAGVRTRGADPVARQRVVLVAQRLEPEKQTDLALEIFSRSALAQRGWTLVVAGQGSLLRALQERAERLGIGDSTRFLGHANDVQTLMADAGVLLAPRPDEAYGLSVVEAMAAGLPVVAAAGGGHLETVGSVPGAALFPPSDTVVAAAALADLAADERRRAAYGLALRDVQRERFTLDAQERATDAVYRSVL